jgi:EmrB/QacA subfamily drug resistance transporter
VEAGRRHYGVTLAILSLAGSAFALQQTMVFPALLTFQREFGTSATWTTWVLTAFLVSAAVSTPILGRLGDQYGKERLLLVAQGLFLAGCVGCSVAWSIGSLIGFRALAGCGAAVFPLSFAIIRDEFPPDRVKIGIGLLSAVFGAGGGVGMLLSGVVVDNLSWRWLFVFGSVAVACAIVLVHRFVPESPVRAPAHVDVPGALLLAAALLTLLVGLTEGAHWGWSSPQELAVLGAASILFLVWEQVERRQRNPLVDIRMLTHPPVLLTNTTALIAGFALFSCFILVPQLVEAPEWSGYGFGATATEAGLFLLPSSIALLFAGPLAGVIGRRTGSKWPLAGGLAVTSVAALLLSQAHDEASHVLLASGLLGLGLGFAAAGIVALIAENVHPTETGVATGVSHVLRVIGGLVGAQLGAAILTTQTIAGSARPAESAFTTAFALSAVAAALAACVALGIRSRPGRMRVVASSPAGTS